EDARGVQHGSPHRDAGGALCMVVRTSARSVRAVRRREQAPAPRKRCRNRSLCVSLARHRAIARINTAPAGNRYPGCRPACCGLSGLSTKSQEVGCTGLVCSPAAVTCALVIHHIDGCRWLPGLEAWADFSGGCGALASSSACCRGGPPHLTASAADSPG